MVVGKIVVKGAWWGGKKVYGAVSGSSSSKKSKLKLRHSKKKGKGGN